MSGSSVVRRWRGWGDGLERGFRGRDPSYVLVTVYPGLVCGWLDRGVARERVSGCTGRYRAPRIDILVSVHVVAWWPSGDFDVVCNVDITWVAISWSSEPVSFKNAYLGLPPDCRGFSQRNDLVRFAHYVTSGVLFYLQDFWRKLVLK